MNTSRAPLLWGLCLIAVGIILLLALAGFGSFVELWFGAVLVAGAVAVFVAYLRRPSRWGLLFPATLLGAIGGSVVADAIVPNSSAAWSGAAFLLALGVPFLAGFTVNGRWGLLIPFGVFSSLAGAAILHGSWLEPAAGAIFFFGLAATFGVLPFLAGAAHVGQWAYPLAIAMAVMGGLVLASVTVFSAAIWAILLISAGLFLLYRSTLRRSSGI